MIQESAVLTISDVHTGKETKSFNLDVLESRINKVVNHAGKVASIVKSAYKIKKLYVLALGDIIDNDCIYKTQKHHLDKRADYGRLQVNEAARILKPALKNLREVADEIQFYGVPGNHGRVSFYTHEANNWDLMLYEKLKDKLEDEKGISIGFTDDFADVIDIEGHGFLMYHGWSIKCYQNLPYYGIKQKVLKWSVSFQKPFRVALFGHFHGFFDEVFGDKNIMISGTAISDDQFSLEFFGYEGVRKYHFFGVHRERPVTWKFGIEMD